MNVKVIEAIVTTYSTTDMSCKQGLTFFAHHATVLCGFPKLLAT